MDVSFAEVDQKALQLEKAEQDRLIEYLLNPPAPPTAVHILQTLTQHADKLHEFCVKRIDLFVSAVRGEVEPGSDIDILVELGQPSLTGYVGLKLFLEGILERSVDLATLDNLRSELRPTILDEVIYAQGL